MARDLITTHRRQSQHTWHPIGVPRRKHQQRIGLLRLKLCEGLKHEFFLAGMCIGREPDGPIESTGSELQSLLLVDLAQCVAVQRKLQTAGHDDRLIGGTQRA